MDSSQASALIWCYCNSPSVGVLFSLFGTGLNGQNVEKLAVLLEGRKINWEERLPSSLCTPPSSMWCQEKFRSVTQQKQGSQNINTLATPPLPPQPPAPTAQTPGLALWGQRWGSLSTVVRKAGAGRERLKQRIAPPMVQFRTPSGLFRLPECLHNYF